MHALSRNLYTKWSAGILLNTALRIVYSDQINYFNTLFLANLESPKDRRIKISKSYFKKIPSSDICRHSLLPRKRNTEVLCKLRNPTNILFHIPKLKDTCSFKLRLDT